MRPSPLASRSGLTLAVATILVATSNVTLAAIADGITTGTAPVNLVYNALTGNVSFDTKGATDMNGFILKSLASILISGNANLTPGPFVVTNSGTISSTFAQTFANGYNLGNVLADSLAKSFLNTDLTFTYSQTSGGGVKTGQLIYNSGAPTVITITVASGTQTQTQAGYATLSGSLPLVKAGAGTLLVDQANTISGSTTVQGGRLQLANGSALGSSRVVPLAGSTLTLSPGLQTTVGGLAPSAGGLVDVGNGSVTVASGLSASAMVAALMTGMGDGSWNGTAGITSSVAAASVGDRTVGWLDNGDGSVAFAFAAAGDTNLDWQVDIIDAANFLAGGKFDSGSPATWNQGDFTYDWVVDILDAASFLSNGLFDAGVYNAPPAPAGVAAVPEPALGWAACGVGASLLVRLRRWRCG